MNNPDKTPSLIHWATSEEMPFTKEHKYNLPLPEDFPFSIRFYQFTAAHPVIPNYHDFYEISYFYSGRGDYHIADTTFQVEPGSVVLIQSGQMHTIDVNPKDLLHTVSIYFMPELIHQAGSNPYDAYYLYPFHFQQTRIPPVYSRKDLDFSIWERILEMHHQTNQKTDFYQLSLKNNLCELLLVFLKRMEHKIHPAPAHQSPLIKIKRLDKVFQHIHEVYASSIPLGQLAEIACMSPAYFSRYFKQVTGLSPVHYIQRYRIEKSKELLVHTDLSITEIAFQIGFNSQSYFDRIFQRFTKQSPFQFRQNYTSYN